jgi:pimeloyl-ACP methyl ester carboxylesterase
MKEKHKAIATIVISLLAVVSTSSFPLANGQPEQQPLPVLLIHGYASDASVWETWEDLLENDDIVAHAITFTDDPTTFVNEDQCGSAASHAIELNQIIEDFKTNTGSEKINIVAHSKGGLDARVYLANNLLNDDVANLIMIGTPNDGGPIADLNHFTDPCKPAVFDLMTTSQVNNVGRNENTNYYTIAGDWISDYRLQFRPLLNSVTGWVLEDINCPYPSTWFDLEGWTFHNNLNIWRSQIIGGDDGIVPIGSVEEPGEFIPLGRTDNCHKNLFTNEEYNKVIGVLFSSE